MNIFADLPQGAIAVLAFLLARSFAGLAGTLALPAAYLLAFAAGTMLSWFPSMASIPTGFFAGAVSQLASGLLFFSTAYLTLNTSRTKSSLSVTPTRPFQETIVQFLPALGFLIPLAGARLFPGTFALETVRPGLILVLLLWLAHQDRPLDLVCALIIWIILDRGSPKSHPGPILSSNPLPYLVTLGSGILILALSRVRIPKQGSPGWNLARDGLIALSVALTFGFRFAGAGWGQAALGSGMLVGLAGRRNYPRDDSSSMRILVFEASLASSFAAGLGMGIANQGIHPLETALITLTALAIPALRGLVLSPAGSGPGRIARLLPNSALPLALLVSTGLYDQTSRSMAFGLALACLAVLPASRINLVGAIKARNRPAPLKPLVAVARRGNTAGILAFASSLADPDQPIRSVCVAATPGSPGPDAAEAEETLVRAVAAGASSGYRILPSLITAASTADGLARAAFERRSDCILTGWHSPSTPSDPESGSVVTDLVRVSPAPVLSLRKPELFNRARRLVFVTMAASMPESGYRQAAALALAAWGRKASALEAIVVGGSADELIGALGLDSTQVRSIPYWRDLAETVRLGGTQVPAFFVAAARPDWAGWNPGSERIPMVLEEAFPEAAIAVYYMQAPLASEESLEDETEDRAMQISGQPPGATSVSSRESGPENRGTVSDSAAPRRDTLWPPIIQVAIQHGRIMTAMKEAVLVDALSSLTKALFPGDRIIASRMASDFSAVARTEPIELAPGILLLHAHAQGLAIPALAIGVNREGWRLVALDEPVRIIIMLVSPVEAGPAAHLEALTQIAKAIRDQGFAQTLLDPEQDMNCH